MCVGDVARPTAGEQSTDVRGVDSPEGNDLGSWLTEKSGEPCLSRWVADRLGERTARDDHRCAGLVSSSQQDRDPTVIAIELQKRSGVQGDTSPVHATLPLPSDRPRISSAQTRSSSVMAPPVSLSA